MSNVVYPTIGLAVTFAQHNAVAPLTWDPVEHMLSRFTFGPTTAQRSWIKSYGFDAWYNTQVGYANKYPIYAGNPSVAKLGTLLSSNPYDARQYLINHDNEYGWDVMDQLGKVTIGLQAWSICQLYETLVDFFSNHLNIANHIGDVWVTRHLFDRDVVRPNVTGSFTDMLTAAAKSPPMLQYLNLAQSTKTAQNENYARELLECHTVGLNYSESDVQNAAKLLTGRSIDYYQHYLYDEYIHATGAVRVLDFTNANDDAGKGEANGDLLIKYLASHKFTAQNIARKLCMYYVSDTPSDALVTAVANAYTLNNTQILPMVSTILRSTEFWESRGQKVRRPVENLLASVRVLDIVPSDVGTACSTLLWAAGQMGDAPLDWTYPNGYPEDAASWRSSSALLDEWQAHVALLGGYWAGLPAVNVPNLYSGAATTADAINMVAQKLTNSAWASDANTALTTFLNEPSTTTISKSLLHWLDASMIAVMMHGPHFALR